MSSKDKVMPSEMSGVWPYREEEVNHPPHYGGDVTYEAIKVIEAWNLGFDLGNTVKYIARAGKKPDSEELRDLQSARWYLDRYITRLQNGSDDDGVTIPSN